MKVFNKILSCKQTRKLDADAIKLGIPGIVLMENAALCVVREVMSLNPSNVQIFCGKGQNGGDGFAAARHLINKGVAVSVVLVCNPDDIKGDAFTNYNILKSINADIKSFGDFDKSDCDIIVDAILGTGAKGELCGIIKDAVEYINGARAYVISADIPSGINADTGEIMSCAVMADTTVTFGFAKSGLYSDLSADYIGKMIIADISIPNILKEETDYTALSVTRDMAKSIFIKRSKAAHKGDMGKIAVIGGSEGMSGAVYMAAKAAERGGAGLVTAIVPRNIISVMMTKVIGCMCKCIDDETDYNKYDAILIGNGMGTSETTRQQVYELLNEYSGTLVIDADGLNVLDDPYILKNCKPNVIITPHIGEMAHLTGKSCEDVLKNKVEITTEVAKQSGATVVLKGANTVVSAFDGTTYINKGGTPAMAKGGSGDILAGLICSVAARRENTALACAAAVYVHANAGVLAEQELGEYSVLPEDILKNIGKAIMNL